MAYWTDKLVASCDHLDNTHLSILSWEYFIYSSQMLRGAFWSTTSTTSPTRKLSLASLHFFQVLSATRNSSLHRFQIIFTRFWINLHRFLGLNATSSATWGLAVLLAGQPRNGSESTLVREYARERRVMARILNRSEASVPNRSILD